VASLKEVIERREREAATLRALAELEPEVEAWLAEDRRLEQEEARLRRRADEALARLREHRRAAEAWRATVRERLAATGASPSTVTTYLGLPARLARPPARDDEQQGEAGEMSDERAGEVENDEMGDEPVSDEVSDGLDESLDEPESVGSSSVSGWY